MPPLPPPGSQLQMKMMVPILETLVTLACKPAGFFFFTFPLREHVFFINKRVSCQIQIWNCHTRARSLRKNSIIDWKAFLPLASPCTSQYSYILLHYWVCRSLAVRHTLEKRECHVALNLSPNHNSQFCKVCFHLGLLINTLSNTIMQQRTANSNFMFTYLQINLKTSSTNSFVEAWDSCDRTH